MCTRVSAKGLYRQYKKNSHNPIYSIGEDNYWETIIHESHVSAHLLNWQLFFWTLFKAVCGRASNLRCGRLKLEILQLWCKPNRCTAFIWAILSPLWGRRENWAITGLSLSRSECVMSTLDAFGEHCKTSQGFCFVFCFSAMCPGCHKGAMMLLGRFLWDKLLWWGTD